MTDEQRFFFDLRGWMLLPAVLSQQEIDAARAECYAAEGRGDHAGYEGELQKLLDHPAIVDILHDILSDDPFLSDDAYGFRCEQSFITVRPPGWSTSERNDNGLPHVVRPPQRANAMRYQVQGRQDLLRPHARGVGAGGSQGGSRRHHVPERFAQGRLPVRRPPTRRRRTSAARRGKRRCAP